MALTHVTSGRPEGAPLRANLLAERQLEIRGRRSGLRSAVARLVGVVIVGAGLAAGLQLAHGRVTGAASLTRGRLTRIARENDRLAASEQVGKARQARAQFLGAAGARRRLWTDVMAIIGQVTPGEIWMSRMVVKESEGRELVVMDGYAASLDILPGFVRTLGQAVGSQETQIEQVSDAQINGRPVVRFTCKVVLRSIHGP
jgi:hypothetical protein